MQPTTTIRVSNQATIFNLKSEQVLNAIRKAMTLNNPKYQEAEKHGRWLGDLEPEIQLWEEVEDGIAFPRGWTRQCLHMLNMHGIKPEIEDRRQKLDPIELEFGGQLRDYQEQAVADILKRDFGVLEAATGSGKTVKALAVIGARRQPTLILVHNKELLNQWAERVRSFLGIEAGLIGDGQFKIQPVTVGIVNTVRKHLDELPQHFGHVVVDECHRTPAAMFTEAVQAFDSRFMLGLSATAYRRDGLTKLIYMTLGDRVHKVDTDQLRATGAVLAPEVIRRETAFRYQYSDHYPRMISRLTRDEARNRQIALDVIEQCGCRLGTALVVSDRVAHCQVLADLIQDSGLKVRVLTGQCKA